MKLPLKPNLPKRLFWEFRYDEMIRFYGKWKIKNMLKNETAYLTGKAIRKVCNFFDLKPEELKCYIRKQSRPRNCEKKSLIVGLR